MSEANHARLRPRSDEVWTEGKESTALLPLHFYKSYASLLL
jgi:hypothetical protein